MDTAEKRQDGFGRAMAELFGKSKDTTPAQQDTQSTPPQPSVSSAPPAASTVQAQKPEVVMPAPVSPPPPPNPFFADADVPPRRENTTYFAAGTSIEGTLHSDSDAEIVGDFSGEIVSEGKVVIHANTVSSIAAKGLELIGSTLTGDVIVAGDVEVDEKSSITGNIRAANLNSAGSIRGNLSVSDSVALTGRASVTGDIRTPLFSMGTGAKLNGRLDMGHEKPDDPANRSANKKPRKVPEKQ